jgi:endonuclease-3
MRETLQGKRERASRILTALSQVYPNAQCELTWKKPLELVVAVILSAQCTDRRVNVLTPPLFKKYRTARDWARTPQDVLEEEIRSAGFFRNKAKNIRALMALLVEKYDGKLPEDFDVLLTLPGIGRKTANLLVGTLFGQPGLIVDTHFIRLSNRLMFVNGEQDAVKIEFALQKVIPRDQWVAWSHVMVFHGRRCCHARNSQCSHCPIFADCPTGAIRGK